MQLIMSPENCLHMYCKKGRIGDSIRADDKLEEWEDVDDAIKEFARLFQELTGNEFESWEREKKIQKKHHKFFPIDVVRHSSKFFVRQETVTLCLPNIKAYIWLITAALEFYRMTE